MTRVPGGLSVSCVAGRRRRNGGVLDPASLLRLAWHATATRRRGLVGVRRAAPLSAGNSAWLPGGTSAAVSPDDRVHRRRRDVRRRTHPDGLLIRCCARLRGRATSIGWFALRKLRSPGGVNGNRAPGPASRIAANVPLWMEVVVGVVLPFAVFAALLIFWYSLFRTRVASGRPVPFLPRRWITLAPAMDRHNLVARFNRVRGPCGEL